MAKKLKTIEEEGVEEEDDSRDGDQLKIPYDQPELNADLSSIRIESDLSVDDGDAFTYRQ